MPLYDGVYDSRRPTQQRSQVFPVPDRAAGRRAPGGGAGVPSSTVPGSFSGFPGSMPATGGPASQAFMGTEAGGAVGRPGADAFAPTPDAQMFGDRTRFEEHVLKQLGANPFMIDPQEIVERTSASFLPQAFNEVFKRQIMWKDRHRMTDEQKQLWQQVVNGWRANYLEAITRKRDQMKEAYNFMMSRFDNARKEKEAAYERRLKTKGAVDPSKAPQTQWLWDDEVGAVALHEYSPSERRWVSTGQRKDAPRDQTEHLRKMFETIENLRDVKGELPEGVQQLHGLVVSALTQGLQGGAQGEAAGGTEGDIDAIGELLAKAENTRSKAKQPADTGRPEPAEPTAVRPETPAPDEPEPSIRELKREIRSAQKERRRKPKDKELYKKLEQEIAGDGEGITIDITLEDLKLLDQFIVELLLRRPVAALGEISRKVKRMVAEKSAGREKRRESYREKLKEKAGG
jgi:hypothetical protein